MAKSWQATRRNQVSKGSLNMNAKETFVAFLWLALFLGVMLAIDIVAPIISPVIGPLFVVIFIAALIFLMFRLAKK